MFAAIFVVILLLQGVTVKQRPVPWLEPRRLMCNKGFVVTVENHDIFCHDENNSFGDISVCDDFWYVTSYANSECG